MIRRRFQYFKPKSVADAMEIIISATVTHLYRCVIRSIFFFANVKSQNPARVVVALFLRDRIGYVLGVKNAILSIKMLFVRDNVQHRNRPS